MCVLIIYNGGRGPEVKYEKYLTIHLGLSQVGRDIFLSLLPPSGRYFAHKIEFIYEFIRQSGVETKVLGAHWYGVGHRSEMVAFVQAGIQRGFLCFSPIFQKNFPAFYTSIL